jgi:hypothetical protein
MAAQAGHEGLVAPRPTANVPGDSAAHRGATAAATTSASVRRSMACVQEQPTERVRPNAREKWPDQTLDQAFGLPEVLVAVGTSRLSCKRAGKTRTLMPVWDSSGESRLEAQEEGAAHSARCRQPILKRSERSRHAANSVGRVDSM